MGHLAEYQLREIFARGCNTCGAEVVYYSGSVTIAKRVNYVC